MNPRHLRILVVEDHRATREKLVTILARLGHWVESCPDAATALARISYDGLDVLLTDAWLPDVKGWDYLAELLKREHLPTVVISMSAGDEVEQRKKSKAAGCTGHLIKPFKLNDLEVLLASL